MACSDFAIPQQLKVGKVLTGQKQEKLWWKGVNRPTHTQHGVYLTLQQRGCSLEVVDVTEMVKVAVTINVSSLVF